jgi:hypothetical protein
MQLLIIYGRLQDLILFLKILMGTRKDFFRQLYTVSSSYLKKCWPAMSYAMEFDIQ